MLLPQSSATSQKDEENDFRFRNSRLDYTAQILYIFARLPKYVQTCIFVDHTHGIHGSSSTVFSFDDRNIQH